MRNALLVIHMLTAVLFVGPVTFAASAFPRQVAAAGDGDTGALGAARVLHRVSRGYGSATLIVGLVGAALTQSSQWSQAWVWVSVALFVVASALLLLVVVPTQAKALSRAEASEPVDPAAKARLHSTTGFYSIAWVIVLVLMVLKPG